jgi:hypothetical protein
MEKRFIKETIKRPRLTDVPIMPIPEITKKIAEQIPPKIVKWNLNIILIIFFILFTIFFLYNCKYGMFKSIDQEVYPYSIVS